METQSLYERLGGEAGIPPLVDTIVGKHMNNPKVKARFRPLLDEPERLEEIRGHLVSFLIEGTGGPGGYSGRSMPDTHHGMNVSVEEYAAVVDDIIEALEEHGLDEATRKDVLYITYQLRPEIVGR